MAAELKKNNAPAAEVELQALLATNLPIALFLPSRLPN